MYKLIVIFSLTLITTGCVLSEAYYTDREFGMASINAFDQQIIDQNPKNAETIPSDMAGIHSEKIMDSYHHSFTRDIADAPTNSFTKGTLTVPSN